MLSRRAAAAVVALSLAGLACSSSTDYGSSGGGGSTPPPGSDVVIVSGAEFKTNTAFNPNPFTVALNGGPSVTVKWGNGDRTTHNLLANGGTPAFASGNIAPGNSYTATFTAAGTYAYHCTIHPNMVGSIVVNP
ncbi:MAG TPA: plastocyanin/azurin family copper-binding protein [Gemmatimonadales bacterium]|nr:plastocyanin/azurin family copper-binding protein [Gemmatimonadales bacterium]